MTNKEIANSFNLLGKLMELKGENPFKIRSYQNAYKLLAKLGTPLAEMSEEEIGALKGVGSAISGKIKELLDTGKMNTLERYKEQVPEGIQELVQIKGLGAKKIRAAWEMLGVESAMDLLYACNENRLIELKGFGLKSQEEVRKQLEFFLKNRSNFLYANVKEEAEGLLVALRNCAPQLRIEETGALRRRDQVLDKLEFLMEFAAVWPAFEKVENLEVVERSPNMLKLVYDGSVSIRILRSEQGQFVDSWLRSTGPEEVLSIVGDRKVDNEDTAFQSSNYKSIPAESRTHQLLTKRAFPERLVTDADILGVVHTHSTFSDGMQTVEEMAMASKGLGYRYLAMTDHSKIAVYADGMDEQKALDQWKEIDRLNAGDADFRIIKGIECDILSDGSLDYEDDFRSGFELVIASIHTNIKMDLEKATTRLIKAIEHPQTNMIGHPTGRLLLGRAGYPVDMPKVIDACAANKVAIEINASPYRLDMDWQHVAYAVEKGVQISINPDAHSAAGIESIQFGVIVARKGWLPLESCLNARTVKEFLAFCEK